MQQDATRQALRRWPSGEVPKKQCQKCGKVPLSLQFGFGVCEDEKC